MHKWCGGDRGAAEVHCGVKKGFPEEVVPDDGGGPSGRGWEAACQIHRGLHSTWTTGEKVTVRLAPFQSTFLLSSAMSLGRWDFYKKALVSAPGDNNCHFLARK